MNNKEKMFYTLWDKLFSHKHNGYKPNIYEDEKRVVITIYTKDIESKRWELKKDVKYILSLIGLDSKYDVFFTYP